jgi:S1-C subfamily serine protease
MPTSGGGRTLLWLGLVVVAAVAGIGFGALWRQPAVAAPAAAAVAIPTAVVPGLAAPASPAPGPTASAYEGTVRPPESLDLAPRAPPAESKAAAPPAMPALEATAFETVVARVMPAIVLVEASGGRGSGFFVAPDTLLTNVHVVGRNSSVTIRRSSGEVVAARVEATAPQVDIAVLKVSTIDKAQPVLTLGSTGSARIGQEVFAIGSALGLLQNTLTRGIVSGIRQTPTATLVQTDAAVNPGNSGGPLIDRTGRVLGIVTMGYTDRQGLNFAVGIDHARPILEGTPAPAPAPPATPAGAPVRGPSPSLPSETEETRAQGERMYEQAMGQLARRADSLENAWRQYGTTCYKGRAAAGLDRPWFVVFDEHGSVSPGCDRWFADFRRQAAEVASGVIAAEEMARQADVYPGVRRDARRRHRLDYAGWER